MSCISLAEGAANILSYADTNSSIFSANNVTGENLQAAHDLYYTNRTGPWTAPLISTVAFPPLHLLTSNRSTLLAQATAWPAARYLSEEMRQHPTVIAGYNLQQQILVGLLKRADIAASEILADSIGTLSVAAMRPFSRGTVRATHANILSPSSENIAIDPRYCSHPADCALLVEALRFNAHLIDTEAMQALQPAPALPWVGTEGETPQQEESRLLDAVKKNLRTDFHPCGTTAMMPLSLGGVVDPSLKVYGTKNLRVVDAGVMPLIPGAHLQATVYAVAEKVSCLIRSYLCVFKLTRNWVGCEHHPSSGSGRSSWARQRTLMGRGLALRGFTETDAISRGNLGDDKNH